jgi:hypothetical protein
MSCVSVGVRVAQSIVDLHFCRGTQREAKSPGITSDLDEPQQLLGESAGANTLDHIPLPKVPLHKVPLPDISLPNVPLSQAYRGTLVGEE